MHAASSAHCWPLFDDHRAFFRALAALGVNASGGTIVNIGAALRHPGQLNHASDSPDSNNDEAWNAFYSDDGRRHGLRMVAYEASPAAIALNELEFNRSGGRYQLDDSLRRRVQQMNEKVDVLTIGQELRRRGVPRGGFSDSARDEATNKLVLLKIDIDSFDLAVLDAILAAHFRPLLVFMETTDWAHKLRFAALPPGRAQRAGGTPPRYASVSTLKSRKFPCMGVSLQMLKEHGPTLGYVPIQDDGRRNTMLVDVHALHRRAAQLEPAAKRALLGATNETCFIQRGLPSKHKLYNWTRLLELVDESCASTHTPYLVSYYGQPCPATVKDTPLHLGQCRSTVLPNE